MKERRSLRQILTRLWMFTGLAALLLSVSMFIALGYVDYSHRISGIESALKTKAVSVARRVSGELLLGKQGAIGPVTEQLRVEHDLDSILIRPGDLCGESPCIKKGSRELVALVKAPLVDPPKTIEVAVSAPEFVDSLNWAIFLAGVFPSAFLICMGLLLQRRFLFRFLVRPIQSLSSKALQGDEIPAHWPKELHQLSLDLEEAVQRRDQALIGQLASGILHDIKTYVHSVSVATDLAKEQVGTEKYLGRLENLFRVCSSQIPRMRKVIDTVLDANRSIQVQFQKADISETVRSSVSEMAPLATASGIVIKTDLQESFADHDPVQVSRIILNLVKNSVEALQGPSGAEREIIVRNSESDNYVTIQVSDSGPGLRVSPERIFKAVRSSKPHGVGLGLLICKKVAEAHGGDIEAQTTTQGARFTVRFPKARVL